MKGTNERPYWRRRAWVDIVVGVLIVCTAALGLLEVVDATRDRSRGDSLRSLATQASIGALASLEITLANAGAGLARDAERQQSLLGCPLKTGPGTSPVAPVVVEPGDDHVSDSMTLMASASATVPEPVAIIGAADAYALQMGARVLRLTTTRGMAVGDTLLVFGNSPDASGKPRCMAARIVRLGAASLADSRQWPTAGAVTLSMPLPFDLEAGSVVHLGASPQFLRVRIDEGDRLVAEDLLRPGADPRVLATGVSGMRVQLGIDRDLDGVVDQWANPLGDDARQAMLDGLVGALRVGLQARTAELVSTLGWAACQQSNELPLLLEAVDGDSEAGLPAMPASRPWTPVATDQCYRYGSASAVIALRNVTLEGIR